MRKDNQFSFVILLTLYFSIGFTLGLNNLLSAIFKDMFKSSYFLSNFVPFAFFSAFCVSSLVYALSPKFKIYFFQRLNYKNLILFGLSLALVGFCIFIPAAVLQSYILFLLGIFVSGLGFTLVQIALTPFVLTLSNPNDGAARLNLAGGVNSLAATVAPIIGVFIFYELLHVDVVLQNLKYPYILLSLCLVVIWLIVYYCLESDAKPAITTSSKLYALEYKNLRYGMLAIFCYLGAEIAIANNLITFLESPQTMGLSSISAGKMLAFYWGGLMLGRFLAFAALSQYNLSCKIVYMLLIAFVVTYLITLIAGSVEMNLIYYYIYTGILIIIFLVVSGNPRYSLVLFAIVAIIDIIMAATMHNSEFAAWGLIAVGLCNSIMWPNILNLALDGLGEHRRQGSSLLMTMVSGGAVIPLLLGKIADMSNIMLSFLVLIVCYLYILFYAAFTKPAVISNNTSA